MSLFERIEFIESNDIFLNLLGPFALYCSSENNESKYSCASFFFKPQNSGGLYLKAASIVAAPLIFSGLCVFSVLQSCLSLLQALFKAIVHGYDNNAINESSLEKSFEYFLIGLECLLIGIVSPVTNLVDFCGSSIVKINDSLESNRLSY